jgi:Bifunctional DNA primase/polymerase, N-terminal/Primase C terminal 1 (PriCT-1)
MERRAQSPVKLLDVAKSYLARRWAVVPMAASQKRPIIKWEEFQDRLPTSDEIEQWFAHWPDANIGIVTGKVSNLVVIDIDPAHGGTDSLAALEAEYHPLPPTIEAITGGGGRHLYFRHPGGVMHNRVGIRPGVDLRGDGGVVVAPPSRHPSGRPYEWAPGASPEDRRPAAMPNWLDYLLEEPGGRGHPVSYWRGIAREGVAQGARNNTIAAFTGHLLFHGVDLDVVRELLLAWNRDRCRPPLSDDEVIRTVESIAKLHQRHSLPLA